MSRAKQYDRIELLNRSVELFRRQGFNGTSTAELVTELGVNRKSMYAEFGSKQQLFEATLEHYDKNHLTRVLSPLEAPDAGLESIEKAFYGYASASEGPFSGLGCLLCNSAVERGALPPESGRFIDAYLERLNRAFMHVLTNAQNKEELAPTVDINGLAGFLTTSLIGMAASVRAEAAPAQLWGAYDVIKKLIQSHSLAKQA